MAERLTSTTRAFFRDHAWSRYRYGCAVNMPEAAAREHAKTGAEKLAAEIRAGTFVTIDGEPCLEPAGDLPSAQMELGE